MTWNFPSEHDVARHRVVIVGEFSFLLDAPVRPLRGFVRGLFARVVMALIGA